MRVTAIWIALSVFLIVVPSVHASTVSASASFTGGLSNTWSFQYVSGAPGIYLQQIKIDLAPGTVLAFDTASGGFGSLAYQDVCCFGGTDVTTGRQASRPAAPPSTGRQR
jgi:hypothetical protein